MADPIPDPPSVVARFARALDREDYDQAAACLHPDCVYSIRGDTHCGAAAIVDSYRGNGDTAAEVFDSIEYGSELSPEAGGWVSVRFRDRITHEGESLEHQCEQRMHVGTERLIDTIEHRDLPGERERLDEFRARHRL